MIIALVAGLAAVVAAALRRGTSRGPVTSRGPDTSRGPAATRQPSTSIVTAVVCVALGAVAAAMASLNVASPDLARSTGATQTQLEWITCPGGTSPGGMAAASSSATA